MDSSKTASGSAGTGAEPSLPETVEVSTGADPRFSVIWLHGLGADGHDFEPVVPELGLQRMPAVRFVFPHAPVRPVTLNGGMPMRAWYDISAISASRDQDEAGILQSAELIDALIQREAERGVPASKLVLAGFSQGGAMALYTGLRYRSRLAGVMALSSYLLFPERLEAERCPANHAIPLFIGHGNMDPMVPYEMGKTSANALEALGYPVEWRSYSMQHSVCMQELADIGQWLRNCMA